jgi:hypothetical protein
MKRIIFSIIILAFSQAIFAGEITLPLESCVVVNTNDDSSAPTRLVIGFTLPEELTGKEVLFAEISGSFPINESINETNAELRLCPLLQLPPVGRFDYYSLGNLTDSMSVGECIFGLAARSTFNAFITDFIREVALSERPNYGLVAEVSVIGERPYKLPELVRESIIRNTTIRIEYK